MSLKLLLLNLKKVGTLYSAINLLYWSYLKACKMQLLQYNLTLDLMLFQHSYETKAKLYGRDIKTASF